MPKDRAVTKGAQANPWVWYVAAFAAAALLGCGGGGGSGANGGGGGVTADPTASYVTGTGSASVGTGGGLVTATDSRGSVAIPANALAAATKVEVSSAPAVAASGAVGDVILSLRPDGTQFASSATLTVKIDQTWLADEWSISGLQIGYWSAGKWALVPTTPDTSAGTLKGTSRNLPHTAMS
jgi:hypothetical protein